MKTIWKFTHSVDDLMKIEMPTWAQILHVDREGPQSINLWAVVVPTNRRVIRTIAVLGTGHPFPKGVDEHHHIGTVIDPPFVWHLFDQGES